MTPRQPRSAGGTQIAQMLVLLGLGIAFIVASLVWERYWARPGPPPLDGAWMVRW